MKHPRDWNQGDWCEAGSYAAMLIFLICLIVF